MSAVPATALAAPVVSPATFDAGLLVDARWLIEHRRDVTVLDTRMTARRAVSLPGARQLNMGDVGLAGSSARELEVLTDAVRELLTAQGVGAADHVVLVDDLDGSAAIASLLCERAGVARAGLLHGGLPAWQRAGGMLVASDEPCSEVPAGPAGNGLHAAGHDRDPLASFEHLRACAATGSARLLDVRSQLEHEGIVASSCCARRGSIPGAVHLEWTALLEAGGELRPAAQVRTMLGHVGIGPNEPTIVFCHAGQRAAFATLALRAAGFSNVQASLGSWHEWAARGQ